MTNKVELNRLSQVNNNEQNFLAALNENLKRIQEAINDTLSRTGVKPNQMEEVLDMNGNRICNVGPAVELTDVVTKQDIQNIIDAANEAIARLGGLVEAGKTALMNYAQEYIYPTVTAALDGAQAAQHAAEAARDALLLNPDYQALTQNLPTLMTLVDNIVVLENIRDNMTELLAVSDDLTNIDAVAADLTNLDVIAGNLQEILRSSTYAQQAAQSASQASTSASNAANSATAAAGSATAAAGSAQDASESSSLANYWYNLARSSATAAAASETNASSSATTAADKANTARIWAEGTDGEVVPLGGSHSAKVWAQYIEEIIAGTRIFGGSFDASTATATLTSAAKAKLGTDDNTIVLTNDTTPITGYAANEAIEYVVTVDGTFAGITLKVNDILWSSGLSWYKIDNSETVIADATESTKGIAALATTVEAEAGVNDTKIMTPLKTKQAIVNNILTGTTDPTSAISSFTGQRYLNTVTGDTFVNAGETVFPAVTYYDVVGSPTISDAYVMSGITNDNYVKMPYIWQPRGPWEVTLQYTPTTSVPSGWYKITGAQVDFSGHSFGSTNNHPQLEATTNGGYWDINIIVNSVTMTPNTSYWFKYGWTGSQYYVKMSTDGTTYTTVGTQNSTTNIRVSSALYIGKTQGWGSGADTRYAKGPMDLSVFRIDENDELSWQAVTPSSTGPGWTKLSNASSVYTKSEVDTSLASKQNTLTAGTGISISSDTVAATAMTGADGINAGTLGAVPAPSATDNTKFLRGDGTWASAGGGGSASYDSTTQEITLG